MSEEIQKTNELLTALRKSHEEGNIALKNELNAKLDAQEIKNANLVKTIALEKKAREDGEAKLAAFEADMKRGNLQGSDKEVKKLEMKAFENLIIKGSHRLSDAEMKYLRTDSNVDGGYLVPIEQSSEIIKKITEVSDVRAFAKVRTLNAKTLRLSTRSALLTGGWAGEAEEGLTNNSQYGREELVAKKLTVSSAITIEELQDAGVNMVNEMSSDVRERFAQLKGASFVNGTGSKQPEGFMANADITSIVSGNAALLTYDSLIKVTGELKTGYNPIYAFNRRTLANIRTMKDGNGAYIFQAGNLGAGVPNQIGGSSYAVLEDMPDIGAGLFPVIYGDFFKGYLIGERAGMTVIRDDLSLKKQGKVEFTFMERLDAMVVLPEAFKKIQISV
jgi:HK97 family phage major capsid protein